LLEENKQPPRYNKHPLMPPAGPSIPSPLKRVRRLHLIRFASSQTDSEQCSP
jgi:hypothetical protein